MNTVKSEEAAKSCSSAETVSGKKRKSPIRFVVVDVSDVLDLFQWSDENLQDNIRFEDVVSQALERRFDRTPDEFDAWLWAMRYLLETYLQGDALEEGVARLEMLVDILADKLSVLGIYSEGRLNYRYLLKTDRLYLMSPSIYQAIVLSEAGDAPF